MSAQEDRPLHYTDTVFGLQDVKLDGVTFERCRFEDGCRLLFFGEAPPRLVECYVSHRVQFVLGRHAALTMQFLSFLAHHGGNGGLQTVQTVIHDLYGGAFEEERA